MKPYKLDEKKISKPVLTSIDLAQWREIIVTNIKAEEDWLPFVDQTWGAHKVANRGLVGDNAAADAVKLQRMLAYIASYAPSSVFRDITQRCLDLPQVWDIIRRWAGVTESSSKHLSYHRLKRAYDPAGSQSPQEFYFALRDAKEDCLITVASKIKYNNTAPTADEELSACLESDVVIDWLDAIGGSPLVEHVFRTYTNELKESSLADIQERIAQNLPMLSTEAEANAEPQASIGAAFPRQNRNQGQNRPFSRRGQKPPFNRPDRRDQPQYSQDRGRDRRQREVSFPNNPLRPSIKQEKSCRLCKAKNQPSYKSHNIAECWLITPDERREFVKVQAVFTDDTENDTPDEDGYEYNYEYDEEPCEGQD